MPEWSRGFPYFLQFKSEFGNKERWLCGHGRAERNYSMFNTKLTFLKKKKEKKKKTSRPICMTVELDHILEEEIRPCVNSRPDICLFFPCLISSSALLSVLCFPLHFHPLLTCFPLLHLLQTVGG